jgi:hypothetical protein
MRTPSASKTLRPTGTGAGGTIIRATGGVNREVAQ